MNSSMPLLSYACYIFQVTNEQLVENDREQGMSLEPWDNRHERARVASCFDARRNLTVCRARLWPDDWHYQRQANNTTGRWFSSTWCNRNAGPNFHAGRSYRKMQADSCLPPYWKLVQQRFGQGKLDWGYWRMWENWRKYKCCRWWHRWWKTWCCGENST